MSSEEQRRTLSRPGEWDAEAFAAALRHEGRLAARSRFSELRDNLRTIVQAGVAAAVAYAFAREVVGHAYPFFAPVAAVLTLSLAVGRRGRRAFEVAVGVAVGIGVADLIVLGIGTGGWQVGVVVALAMVAAILVGGSTLLINQAAVSAVLVATIQTPGHGISGARFIDALVGGAVALLANALAPTDPVRLVRKELDPLLEELAGALDDTAAGLEEGDVTRIEHALERARSIDPQVNRFSEAVSAAEEMSTMSPFRRRSRDRVSQFSIAAEPVDHAVRNVRVLTRGSIRAVDLDERIPPRAISAIGHLADAVRALGSYLEEPGGADDARDAARRAAAESAMALEETSNLAVAVIIGQIRSTATDILRGIGDDTREARAVVRTAVADATTTLGSAAGSERM